MNHLGTFPFGQPVKPVYQTDRSPKRVFVLGVYASAVHAKWIDSEGRQKVQALAVASEPYIFWRGDGVEEIIEKLEKLEQDEWNVNDGTWWRRVTIFGINIIEIRGQYPYDNSNVLDALFKSLPFSDKIKTEVDFDV